MDGEKLIYTIQEKIYKKVFRDYTYYLRKEIENCETALDLGCGRDSPLRLCRVPYSVGVELFEPYLKESKKKRIHSEYICADVRKIEFKEKSFDCVLALDVLEHLTKEEANELVTKMMKWAKRKVIIFTPNGFLSQEVYDNNSLQIHKSGFTVNDLYNIGFKVYGINGWSVLRGHKAQLRFRPTVFWKLLSDITELLVLHCPQYAFQLLAIRELRQ